LGGGQVAFLLGGLGPLVSALKRVCLSLNGTLYDPTDPTGRVLFGTLELVAVFDADLMRMRTLEGLALA
jgi:hypothetical protein